MPLTLEFIRSEVRNEQYEITLHADDERLHDNLTLDDLEHVLLNGELIE